MTATKTDQPAPGSEMASDALLSLLHPIETRDELPQRWVLSNGIRVIGRAVAAPEQEAAIEFAKDDFLSQRHACIVGESGRYVVRDAQSRNGTFVNGKQVREHVLSDGDVLRMGGHLLVFRAGGMPMQQHRKLGAGFVAKSPAMHVLLSFAEQVAARNGHVLILGDSGTGKEHLANYIHRTGRANLPLVAVNCATLVPELADSALFGHVRGAFTGATASRLGAIREAGRGTLFLDEIGELPSPVQAKLLRALSERTLRQVGASSDEPFEARIIAATNRDLEAESSQGAFRKELYYRLRATTLELPPLRARREDILPILWSRLADGLHARLTHQLAEALLLHDWPENVRGVINLAEYWQTRHAGSIVLDLSHLPSWLSVPPSRPEPSAGTPTRPPQPAALPSATGISKERLLELLAKHKGKKSAIARETGCSDRQVGRWLETYQLNFWQWRAK